jgi:hypothetical protein
LPIDWKLSATTQEKRFEKLHLSVLPSNAVEIGFKPCPFNRRKKEETPFAVLAVEIVREKNMMLIVQKFTERSGNS